MLVNLRDIMAIAEQNNMAVGAFNTPSFEGVRAAIDAAEETGLPVIVAFAQMHESITPIEKIGPAMVSLAERSSAQVCVHLDHCEDLSYMRRALEMGFSGVMYDGSALPYEENVANSQRAAAMVSNFDCGLECELGSLGARENGAGHEDENESAAEATYTDPEQAAEFIAATGLDCLACSFGTVHGIYKGEPRLSLGVLTSIRERSLTPLVMHGGSGVSDADYLKAIDAGIRKVNYYTYGAKYAGEAVRETISRFVSKDVDSIVYWHDMTMAAYDKLVETYIDVVSTFANNAGSMK